MKKVFRLFAIAVLGLSMMTACNSDEKQIKDVAEKYLKAVDNLDFDGAKQYATEETGSMLDFMDMMDTEEAKAEAGKTTFEMGEVTINGEEDATIKYTANGEESELQLKKVEGKWLVNQPKEAPAEPEEDMMMDDSTMMDSTMADSVVAE